MAEGVLNLSDYLSQTPPPEKGDGRFACYITAGNMACLIVREGRKRKRSIYPNDPKEAKQPILEGYFRLSKGLLKLAGRTVSLIPLTMKNYDQFAANIGITHDTALGEIQVSKQPYLKLVVSVPLNSAQPFPVNSPIIT